MEVSTRQRTRQRGKEVHLIGRMRKAAFFTVSASISLATLEKRRFPHVVFLDTRTGRVAGIAGTGLAVFAVMTAPT